MKTVDEKPLTDNEVGNRLHAAEKILGKEPGATEQADTALSAARKALRLIKLALVAAGVKNGD